MTKVLFIVGNGFDLNIGLKTGFNDVFKWYKNLNSNSDEAYIKEFISELEQNPILWSDYEKQLGRHTLIFNKNNLNIFNDQVESFRKALISKLKFEQNRIVIPSKRKHIISEFFIKSITGFYHFLPKTSRDTLSSLLSLSHNNLKFEYNFLTFNYTNTLERLLNFVKYYSKTKTLRSYQDGNYSTPVNDNIGEVIHIHGTLDKACILGVDNKNQIVNKILSKDKDMQWLIKPYQNKLIGENTEKNAKKLIDTSNVICVYGMSLGVTDKSWWVYINNWLKADTSRHLVIFFYNNELDATKLHTLDTHKNKVLDTYFSLVGRISKKEKLELTERIHIPFDIQNMFKLNLLENPNKLNRFQLFDEPTMSARHHMRVLKKG